MLCQSPPLFHYGILDFQLIVIVLAHGDCLACCFPHEIPPDVSAQGHTVHKPEVDARCTPTLKVVVQDVPQLVADFAVLVLLQSFAFFPAESISSACMRSNAELLLVSLSTCLVVMFASPADRFLAFD